MADLFSKITGESAGSTPFEFTSVTEDSGNTFAPSTDWAAAGSYSYEADFSGSGRNSYGWKAFTSANRTEIYLKFSLLIGSTFSMDAWSSVGIFSIAEDWFSQCVILMLYSNGSSTPAGFELRGNGITATDWTAGFATNTEMEIEIYWKYGTGATTECWVKIDGTERYNSTTITSAITSNDGIFVGGALVYNIGMGGSIYYDEIEGYDAIPSGSTQSPVPIIMQSMNQFNGGV